MKELSLNILDIVQNSIRANATEITIAITESEVENLFQIVISDNGAGIPGEMLPEVTSPFTTSRTKRKVGMGLAFLSQQAELAGGSVDIVSKPGNGTRVEANFSLHHIDRQPLGDIAGVIKILMVANPAIDFTYEHQTDKGIFRINTKEIKEVFEVTDLTDYSLMEDIRKMILQNLESIEAREICAGERECF